MKLAIKELLYSKKKYFLVTAMVVLLMFMVLFLSGLANGLGRAVSAAIDEIDADGFLISEDSENLITVSNLSADVFDELNNISGIITAPLDIQRMYLSKNDSDDKLNITYFAIPAGSFLEPDIFTGSGLNSADNAIILDDDFQTEGINIGDIVKDSSTGLEFVVSGFSKDKMYGHTSVGYITTDSYTRLRTALSPNYQQTFHAFAIKGNTNKIQVDGAKVASKSEIIENLPSYKAEQSTINMIIWVLVAVSAAILGVFYYIITLQKEKQFGVMKAIGTGMGKIAGIVCSQVVIVAFAGALLANILTYLMTLALPQTMPFWLNNGYALIISAAFILISLVGGLLSVRRISKVDPIISIGGEE